MRRESARAERRRTLLVVLVAGVVALAIVGGTAWKLYDDAQRSKQIAGTELTALGVDSGAAGCGDVITAGAEGQGEHLDGQEIDYPDAPPAFGAHWSNPTEFGRTFYTDADRPDLERLVHNLEHGYTVLWYDQTIADDAAAMRTIEDLAAKFDVDDPGSVTDIEAYNESKFIAAPWTEEDGEPFPDGKHVALTHWAIDGDDAVEGVGMGAWEYCDQPSGEALGAFMADYPASNSPEPQGQ